MRIGFRLKGLGFSMSIAIVFLSVLVFNMFYAYTTKDVILITPTSKERIYTQETSKYMIFTEDEVFQNTDSLWYFKLNSSDVYGKLEIGERYLCDVYGWRIRPLSSYRNIIDCKKMEKKNHLG